MISHIAPRFSNALVTHQTQLLHISSIVCSNRREWFGLTLTDDIRHFWNLKAVKIFEIWLVHERQTPWVRLALCSKRFLEKKLSGLQVDEKHVVGRRKCNFVKIDP
jgi:hypothetical protein